MINPSAVFAFSPEIEAGLLSGQLKQVFHNGVPVGQVRNAITGHFVKNGMAIGLQSSPLALSPSLGGLSQAVGLLQMTTGIIGVGVAASVAISAVNLYQTFKLREDVKQMQSEMKDGFGDLTKIMQNQGQEILEHVDRVAQDVKFNNHRTILSQAHAKFVQANQRLQTAMTIQDPSRRDAEIIAARDMMNTALSDYQNSDLLQNINAAGYIRRRECVWAIAQAIAYSFQLQGEYAASRHEFQALDTTIRQDSRKAVAMVNSEAELDFLFPEILHIQTNDLVALDLWQAHLDWLQALPAAEIKQLSPSELSPIALSETSSNPIFEVPPAQTQYDTFKAKSHYAALKDQLQLLVEPDRRSEYITVINQAAQTRKLHALTPDNLKAASDFTIANLYHYLQSDAA